MTPLPEKFWPYLPYLIYGQIVLFASAILLGGFLVLRRLARKAPLETQILEEKEKLAAEIHQEILRLRDLRDRLFDGFKEGAEPVIQVKTTIQQSAPGSESGAVAELQKKNKELQAKIDELLKEIEALKAAKSEPLPTATGAAALVSPEKIQEIKDSLRKDIETEVRQKLESEMGAKVSQHESTIKDLSSRLEEYEIFEEELAQIKKYKSENDKLKEQVAAGGGVVAGATSTSFSEDDIAQLFGEMTGGGGLPGQEEMASGRAAVPTTGIEAPKETKIEGSKAGGEGKKILDASTDLDKELEALMAGSAGAEAVPGKSNPPPGFETEAQKDEPAVPKVGPENAEALAMLGNDEDELLKEFEKVLAPKEKDK